MTNNKLGIALRQARLNADMSQGKAKQESGVAQGTISAYERGTARPTKRNLERLCEVYGCKMEMMVRQLDGEN